MPLRLVISCAAVAIAVVVPVAILYRIMIMDWATTGALDRYQTPLSALFYFIDPATIDPVERIQAPLFALFYALLVGSRSTGRTLNRDVQSVETLGHSWGHAASGGIKGLVFGSIFGAFGGIIIFQGGADDVSRMMAASAVMIGVLGGAVGAVFDGMQSSVRELKNRPNEGIMLSVRNATVYALGLGVFCGFAFFVYCCVILKGMPYSAGIIPALWAGSMIMLITFIWFGGLEIIRHYTLRALLCIWGFTPCNYVRFLDYAAGKLVFLEKVGGGYKFIHRYLLEHFAELQTAAGNSPPGSSRKPADSPLLASRDDRPRHELPR